MSTANYAEQILTKFHIQGNAVSCREFGSGHINDTYKVETDDGHRYILQRINKFVFNNPVEVMQNVSAVTDFLRKTLNCPDETLHFIRTDENLRYFVDENDDCWRCYEFADGVCLEAPETEEDFYQSAIAFGRFQEMLSDFPADTLHETIPLFHNTVNRYRLFKEALDLDRVGRASTIAEEVEFIMEREEEAGTICRLLDSGELPLRVTHNDTKINNIMIDENTGKAVCVIDLDTVMAGSALYDYGDAIRFGANTAAEDEADTSKISLDLNLFREFTAGFLSEVGDLLTEEEIACLPLGIKVMTCELAMRFLTDYIDGDLYFRVKSPDHNLVRAHAQMKLLEDIESKNDEMNAIIAELIAAK